MTDRFTDEKRCNECQAVKPLDNFPPVRKGGTKLRGRCRSCQTAYARRWRETYPDRKLEVERRWRAKGGGRDARQRRRKEARELLGGVCVRCGFSDPRALQIDHIHGGGNQERKHNHDSAAARVIRGEVGFQLLCANCNVIKRIENHEHGGYRKQVS